MMLRVWTWLDFTHMSHRPPLPAPWWAWCAAAYLAPSLVLTFVSAEDVPYRDIVWLVTLVPAFLLSLHYGMRGAVAGLIMGTVLFTTIQFLVASNLEPEDWRITVPIYAAYGAIAISVGWLSQELHLFYARAIEGERIEVVGQLAIAIRHEVNNALATIVAEAQILAQDARLEHPEDKAAVDSMLVMARRIQDSLERLTRVTHAPTTDYVEGLKMIDLAKLKVREPEKPA
jgi:signal transduction histidine kinase